MKIEYALALKPKPVVTTIGKGLKVQKPVRKVPGIRKGVNAIKGKGVAAKNKKPGKTLNLMGSRRR
jgi:hypothetical protein